MPVFSPFQNLTIRQTIVGIAKSSPIELRIPTFLDCTGDGCGLDEYSGQAKNPDCAVCQGRGTTRVDARCLIMARVAWFDHGQQGIFMSMPTGETADVQIQTDLRYQPLFELVHRTEGAYIIVDGKTMTVKSITRNRIEGLTSLDVRLGMTNQDVLGAVA
jgi:hypothetical protein